MGGGTILGAFIALLVGLLVIVAIVKLTRS